MSTFTFQRPADPLRFTARVPGSKSLSNRALVAAALADGTSVLKGLLLAEDTRLMIGAIRALGVAVTLDEAADTAEVTGCRGHIPHSAGAIWCGNAGTVMRFCTALVSTGQGRFDLDGVERMRHRPIRELAEVLQSMRVSIEYLGDAGFPPIRVHSTGLAGGTVCFDSPQSSQMISALLLAAPYAQRDVMIEATGRLPSVPYLKMTNALMDQFGVGVVEQYEDSPPDEARSAVIATRFIVAAPQRYLARTLSIEPDASNASYFLAAPAIAGGTVTVQGLGTASTQGDARFVDVLEKMGCVIERRDHALTVHGPREGCPLSGVDVDLNDMPDMVQTLAVVALFACGPTVIRNVANLRVKETDRLAALRAELTKLGATVEERADGVTIHPPQQLRPAAIATYGDHRMAMSFALAGLRCPGLVIENPECCAKTFPDFFDRFAAMMGQGR